MFRYKEGESVPVRPHHGLCLAYFQGSGYSEEFTAHMQEMLELFQHNIPVVLTVSTDEICSACPNNGAGACKDRALVEGYDRAVLEKCGISEGERMNFMDFARIVQKQIISPGLRSEICGKCQWDDICRNKKSRWIQQ